MDTIFLALLSVGIVSAVSLIGVFTLSFNSTLLRNILPALVGLAAGALLGDAFIHLIPEALHDLDEITFGISALGGLIFFFFLEKWLRWHHAHHGKEEEHTGHDCAAHSARPALAPLVILADALHNVVDGAIIATSFLVSPALGIATTVAVILHEIPQEIADFGLLVHAGLSRFRALLFNFGSALTALVGLFVAVTAASAVESFTPIAIAFTAGGFIYIAAADLIPELHRHVSRTSSLAQVAAFILGIVLMFVLTLVEVGH